METLVIPNRSLLARMDVSVVLDPDRPRLTELRRRAQQLLLFRQRLLQHFPRLVGGARELSDDVSVLLPSLEAFFADDQQFDLDAARASGEITVLFDGFSIRRGAFQAANETDEPNASHLSHINVSSPQPAGAGAGTIVGTVDAGLASHIDFSERIVSSAYLDNLGETHAGLKSDPDGHGTRLAGLLVGKKTGVVPGAALAFFGLPSRAFGNAYDFSIFALLRALNWLGTTDHGSRGEDVGCDVINVSLEWSRHEEEWFTLINSLVTTGILVVVAAGNQGPNAIASPANYQNVLTVGSTNLNDEAAANSATGPAFPDASVDKPELYSVGELVYSTARDGGYNVDSGTSFAAPLVAGAATLLISLDPANLRGRPHKVIKVLLSSNTSTTQEGGLRVLSIS